MKSSVRQEETGKYVVSEQQAIVSHYVFILYIDDMSLV